MSESGIEVALRLGFYKLTANDMAKEGRKMLNACPTCRFSGLEVGKTYIYRYDSYGNSYEMLTVRHVTPERAQAVVVKNGHSFRIYKGSYGGTFSELDADLIALTDITHEKIVKAALDTKYTIGLGVLDIPPTVRREYPHLFVEIPDRFAQSNRTPAERVKNALSRSWVQRGPVTPETLDAQIEEAHNRIAELQDTRCQAVAVNPDTAIDYDRYIIDLMNDIDFYRWLYRLVDVGGVFHIDGSK